MRSFGRLRSGLRDCRRVTDSLAQVCRSSSLEDDLRSGRKAKQMKRRHCAREWHLGTRHSDRLVREVQNENGRCRWESALTGMPGRCDRWDETTIENAELELLEDAPFGAPAVSDACRTGAAFGFSETAPVDLNRSEFTNSRIASEGRTAAVARVARTSSVDEPKCFRKSNRAPLSRGS